MKVSIDNDPVELEIGFEVYIGPPPAVSGNRGKAVYLVTEIDERGNAKMHSTRAPHYKRNFPNVDILAGKLWRRDGRQIKGKIIPREPMTRSNRSGYRTGDYRNGPSL